MFSSIHHVALIVSDYQKAKHFYVDILGFEILRENHRKDSEDIKLDLGLDGCELGCSINRTVLPAHPIPRLEASAIWPFMWHVLRIVFNIYPFITSKQNPSVLILIPGDVLPFSLILICCR